MRLVLRAAFDRFSGYGNDAVDMAINLQRLGVEVTPWPTGLLPGLPREFLDLLEKDGTGKKDVLLQFSDPATLTPWDICKGFAPKVFGYSMWERTPLRPEDLPWKKKRRDWSSYGMTGLAVTCDMNVDAFRNVDPEIPMTVVPCGIEADDWPVRDFGDPGRHERPVRFLMSGVLGGRKDPLRMLVAWHELMAEYPDLNAELVMHSFVPGMMHPGMAEAYGPKVTVLTRALPREELVALYHSCDVLVSVSRGEGNNKPALEFMATGGTVMASDWSGHQNWLNPFTTALPGELGIAHGAPGCQEFYVSHDGLKKAIVDLATNPVKTREDGERCARWVRDNMTWAHTLPQLVRWMEATG